MAQKKNYLNLIDIKITVLAIVGLTVLTACSGNNKSDAYGQFEATEITVSSQTSGKIRQFTVDQGDILEAGLRVGTIDTTQMVLKKRELKARIESTKSKIENITARVDVQKEELQLALTHLNRVKAMYEDEAATDKELDNAQAQVRIIKQKIEALQTQKKALRADIKALQVRIDQINERIKDAQIINPVRGTVLTTFVQEYEFVRKGQPLYRIADMDTLILQVYVSGSQLPHVKLGEKVQVLVDKNAEEYYEMTGTVTWIANKAEFTPSSVQTKEERVTQVYAVEVRVPNPKGILKIGMPGEVNFSRGSAQINTD